MISMNPLPLAELKTINEMTMTRRLYHTSARLDFSIFVVLKWLRNMRIQ